MSTISLTELRVGLGQVVREVALTGEETIITASGKEVAAIISIADYERLHEHADLITAARLRRKGASAEPTITLAEALTELGIVAEDVA